MKPLHPHQHRAIQLLRHSLATGHTRPLVQAPTGFGKTILASHIVNGARAKGNRVIFVVPAISLVDQTVSAFRSQGIHDIGVLQGNHEMTDSKRPIQVASIQTLSRRQIPHADIVVVDEAHQWFKFMGEWMGRWTNIPFVGLSATPWTKGLGKHYDDLIIAATTEDLIRAGYLSKFRVFAPSKPDLSNVKTVAGDYAEDDLAEVMDKPPLIAHIVTTWKTLGENRPTLVFAVNCAHAKHIQADFNGAGIPCGYVDADTPRVARSELGRRFNAGELRVIVNVGCLTTGVDWDVRCIVLARPTKSEILFTQIIGRGLRTAEGKDHCLILDHSDTHQRLGFVTDIHHESLCDGTERANKKSKPDEKPLPKECPRCTFVKPPRVSLCPACGFKAEAQSGVEVAEGKLEELTPKQRNRQKTPDWKRKFYGELLQIAKDRGYSYGWASNQYRQYFGCWPNAYRDALPCTPSEETLRWVKHRQIAYAKSRERASA